MRTRARAAVAPATLGAMSSVSSIALSGLQAAWSDLQARASNIANAQTPGFRRLLPAHAEVPQGGVDVGVQRAVAPGEDLIADSVGLIEARSAFAANLAVFKTGDRMLGTLLDLRA